MIKILLMGLGIVTLITAGVLGWKPVYGYFKTSRDLLKKNIEDNIPVDVEVSRLESMIDDLTQVMRKHEKLYLEREVDLDMLHEEIKRRQLNFKKQKESLEKAQTLLKQNLHTYDVGGKEYTHHQISQDALRRLERYESDQKMIEIRKQTAHTLSRALSDARHQLASMKTKRQEYAEMLQVLRANHLQLEAKRQLAATVRGIHVPDVQSEFGEVEDLFNRLNKRLKVEGELLDKLPIPVSFEVDYEVSFDSHQENLLSRLNQALLDSPQIEVAKSVSEEVEYNKNRDLENSSR